MQQLPPLCFPHFPLPFSGEFRFLGLYTGIFLYNHFFIQKGPDFGKNIGKSRRFLVTLPLTGGGLGYIIGMYV